MSPQTRTRASLFGILCAVMAATLAGWSPARAADPQPRPLKSGIVSFDDAKATKADWGELRRYFGGETVGTKNVLTAVAIIKPGKAIHRAHRHAQEEYLVVAEGTGTWSLAGKESPAKRGDILYAEPWVFHGLTNIGTDLLIFVVVRFSSKDVKPRRVPTTSPMNSSGSVA